jgi:integrase/recombinase XerD
MKPSVSLILLKARKKKDERYPVKVRVIFQREYHDYKTSISLTETEFEESMKPAPKKAYRELNSGIIELKNRVDKIVNNLKLFTFEKFKNEYYGRIKDASDIYSIFDAYIASLEKEDRFKTATSYQTAKISIQKYKPKLSLYDITPAFLQGYQSTMLSQGKSITTIGIYLRSLRTIYNYAVSEGIIKRDENYPFVKKKYVIPAARNVKKSLSEEQLVKLYQYKAIPGTMEDWARDMWFFSYLCNGINFKDIALLKGKNIDGDMLRFVREKTKRSTIGSQTPISCALPEQAKEIIKKWGKEDAGKDDYLFNILGKDDEPLQVVKKIGQFIKLTNKYIKRIAEKVNLGIQPTTYHARHSFATTLKKSGVSNIVIQEQLGHSSSKTTESYLASFGDDVKREISSKLTDFL